MTLSELISNAILKGTGELFTGTFGDDDSDKLTQIANQYIVAWAREPGVNWASLYDPAISLGTVTATDTFDLDDSINRISNLDGDFIRILHSNGTSYSDYSLISPNRLKHFPTGSYAAIAGKTLLFNNAFTSTDQQFGGTINVPAYVIPDPLVAADDEVPVDEPQWLVLMCAAEWARTDLTLAQNYPLILAEANQLMIDMKQNNRPQVELIAKVPVARGTEW